MQSIGRYQLLEKLGQGGMGVVYRARDTLLERIVAVKVISAPIDQNAELRERFFREARAAGKLSHRNIITIHDLGEHEGQPYLAMEYLDGQDLLGRMAAPQRLSLRRKLEIATEMCEGLDYAHVHGVVHRDIKPANIYITDGGTVKILDFGLARLVTSELTRSNMMMGTINYMAPEQIRGEKVDHRADIFSTSVVLYELLSGRRAFEAESFAATLYKILQEVPESLQQIDPTLPVEVVQIVERGLCKDRDERYQHMSEMLVDLAVYRQRLTALDSPGSGRPTPIDARTPSEQPTMLSAVPPPTPISTPVPPPTGPISGAAAGGGVRNLAFLAIALLALSIAGVAMWKSSSRPDPAPANTTAPPRVPDAPTTDVTLTAALRAFEAGDFASAVRHADEVLSHDAANVQARDIRDRARTSAAKVEDGLANARALAAKGQFAEASRAALDVLAVAPGNAEAVRIRDDGAARSRSHGAEDARAQVTRSKAAARAAGAQRLAAGPYGEAVAAERDAQRLYAAGRLDEATLKFYDAMSLFRRAETTAQIEQSARASAERAAAARTATGSAPSTQAKPLEPEPARGAAPTADVPQAVAEAPPQRSEPVQVAPPAPPPPVVAPPAAPAAPAPTPAAPVVDSAAVARDAITDVLARYVAAVEGRDMAALKRVWPGLAGREQEALRVQFRNASRIGVEVTDPRITLSGDTAIVNFIRRYEVLTVDGVSLQSSSHATMDLRRSGSSWQIERIRFVTIP
jgi:eukaryotic-like serine/threonine-protein kinase